MSVILLGCIQIWHLYRMLFMDYFFPHTVYNKKTNEISQHQMNSLITTTDDFKTARNNINCGKWSVWSCWLQYDNTTCFISNDASSASHPHSHCLPL